MGTQFGKYQLLKKIAAGGMAEIYLAKQRGMEGFEKIVVVKMILPNLANNQEFVQMFLDEARLAAKLTHPNIVQIFDLGRAAGTYFIAMEYIQGENLRAISKACRKQKHVIPLEHTVKVISQACEGLYHAHSKTDMMGKPLNVVHRDISPQNILVSFEGMTKIVDFGIAKATTQYQETRSGVLKGKYAYMSPEQCLGRNVDARSDLFSLGIVLWELATGVRLFKKKSELVILKEITEGSITPPRQINQQVPAELEAIILKALEKNPENRFQDALQMHLALEEFMKNQEMMSSTVHLSAFMRELFKDKLDTLRKIEQAQRAGDTLESFLFDDVDLGAGYDTGTGTSTPSQPSSISPSQSLYPRPTTGISRIGQPPLRAETSMATQASKASSVPRTRKSPLLLTLIMLLLLTALGVGSYTLYEQFFNIHPSDAGDSDAGTEPKDLTANISITSSPSKAMVFIDGTQKCITPCEVKGLKIGTFYSMEVRKGGYARWEAGFKLDNSSEERSFNARLKKHKKFAVGIVKILSNPSGANIELDGKPRSEKTPATLTHIPAGTNHTLRVFMKGRKDWTKSFTLKTDEKIELSTTLTKISSSSGKRPDAVFSLHSRPRGASFYLDGRPVGSSVRLTPGKTYKLSASMKGYNRWADSIRPGPGEKKRIVARLLRSSSSVISEKKAKLFVDCKPWANVYLDGKSVGQTPITDLAIQPGKHTLRVANPDLNQTKTVNILAKPGQTIRKKVSFSVGTGKLLVWAKPWADVYVDGKKRGTTPLPPLNLLPGTHRIRLHNPTLDQERIKTVKIKVGQATKIDVNFFK